jgi:putative FmdB family regulatory protein
MPTYEYHCDACGKRFEKFQSMSAKPLKKCQLCGKNRARRLLSAGAGLIFKGSGFYITDYRDSSYKEKAKAESGGGESKPATDSTAKPESTKPDKKSEPKAAAPKADKPAKKK